MRTRRAFAAVCSVGAAVVSVGDCVGTAGADTTSVPQQYCGFYGTQVSTDATQATRVQVVKQWAIPAAKFSVKISTDSSQGGASVSVVDPGLTGGKHRYRLDFVPTDFDREQVAAVTVGTKSSTRQIWLMGNHQVQELFTYDSVYGLRHIDPPNDALGRLFLGGFAPQPGDPSGSDRSTLLAVSESPSGVHIARSVWIFTESDGHFASAGGIDVPGARTSPGAFFVTDRYFRTYYDDGSQGPPVTDPFHTSATLSWTDGTTYWRAPIGADDNDVVRAPVVGQFAHAIPTVDKVALEQDPARVDTERLVAISDGSRRIYTIGTQDLNADWSSQTLPAGVSRFEFGYVSGERFGVLAWGQSVAQLMTVYLPERRMVTSGSYTPPAGSGFTSGDIFAGVSINNVYLSTASKSATSGMYSRGHLTHLAGYPVTPIVDFHPSSTRPGRVAGEWTDNQKTTCGVGDGGVDQFQDYTPPTTFTQASVMRGNTAIRSQRNYSTGHEYAIFDGLPAGTYRLRISNVTPWQHSDVFSQYMTIRGG